MRDDGWGGVMPEDFLNEGRGVCVGFNLKPVEVTPCVKFKPEECSKEERETNDRDGAVPTFVVVNSELRNSIAIDG